MTTTMNKKTRQQAEELMRTYVQCLENKKALQARIANEIKAYDENMKYAEDNLMELGEKYKDDFDKDGNLHLGDGYLHIVNSAVVITSKKFDVATFHGMYPDLIDISLKKGDIKKAFTDKDMRKSLTTLGVSIDNEQSLKIIANKKV